MEKETWRKEIRFASLEGDRDAIIDAVNGAIEADSQFFASETLSGTLKEYSGEFIVTISESETSYRIDMAPRSGEGHDFGFAVDKDSGKVDRGSLVVGQVEPEPE